MGTGNLSTGVDGDVIPASIVNQYKSALTTDLVPRNASGIPAASAGDLGTSAYPYKDGNFSGDVTIDGKITQTTSRLNLLPSGIEVYFAGESAPFGWLLCKGETIGNLASGATHAAADLEDLFNIVKLNYGNVGTEVFGDGDTVALPDPRGYYMRVLDQGVGIDSGRAIGSTQADQNQSHTHTPQYLKSNATSAGSTHYGTSSATRPYGDINNDSHSSNTWTDNDTSTRNIRNSSQGGAEVRVKSFAQPMIIKI